MIQQTMSIPCEHIQMEYKAKFLSKSNDYTLIENKKFINWFYQKFTQMNIQFPWRITIERKIHDYIQKSSLELISFIEHTAFITKCFSHSIEINDNKFESILITNETLHINFDLKLALKGVSFLTNIFHGLSIHLKNLANVFHLWFMLIKFVIVFPHVAGACSACNDLKQKQVYNSLLFASTWFNSTFLMTMNNESIDIDQLIEKCKYNPLLWSINDFIRLALLENKNTNIDKMNREDIDLNQYHLIHYLITTFITTISHLFLYLITILLRRFIQNYKYEYTHQNFSFQLSPILTTDHSMMIPSNENQQGEIEKKNIRISKSSNNNSIKFIQDNSNDEQYENRVNKKSIYSRKTIILILIAVIAGLGLVATIILISIVFQLRTSNSMNTTILSTIKHTTDTTNTNFSNSTSLLTTLPITTTLVTTTTNVLTRTIQVISTDTITTTTIAMRNLSVAAK
ncbi:unnamed protein product [Rotaria sp. Silwood1]|nr:unnamed protein product [Rotaria sp. Silwood1]